MHFDWYQATIQASWNVIQDAAVANFSAHDVEHVDRGGNGYTKSSILKDTRGDTICTLRYGSNSASPLLVGTSHNAEPVSGFIRANWPKHSVSRVDVAEDMSSSGLFDILKTTMRTIAHRSGVDSGLSIEPDNADKGRTYYMGSSKSAVMVRLYEKGRELAAKGRISTEDVDHNWCRLEIQCRPQKEAKRRFAFLQPSEAWGSSKWTKDLVQIVMDLDVERLYLYPRRESDLERTTDHVVFQFRNHAIKHGSAIALVQFGTDEFSDFEKIDIWCDYLKKKMHASHEIAEAL